MTNSTVDSVCIILFLFKASPNHVDDSFLLLRRHLIITRQAHASLEDICTDILYPTRDIRVGPAAEGAFSSDGFVHAVHRLHVHRLPDRTAFGVD